MIADLNIGILWDDIIVPAFTQMKLLAFTDLGMILVPIAFAVGAAATVVFAWWAVRKASRIIMAAFRNGSLRM